MLILGANAFASSKSWTGGGDGVSWSDKNNWSGGLVPDSSSDVTIGVIAGNPTISVAVVAQAHSLSSSQPVSISSAGSLTLGATSSISALTVNIGTLTVAGTGTSRECSRHDDAHGCKLVCAKRGRPFSAGSNELHGLQSR